MQGGKPKGHFMTIIATGAAMRRSGLAALLLAALVSAAPAQEGTASPETLVERLTAADAEVNDQWRADLRALVARGPEAMPPLVAALGAAGDENERITLTYLMNVVLTESKMVRKTTIEIGPETVDLLSGMLATAETLGLKANLLNLAGLIGPDALPMAPEILGFLASTDNPDARATSQAVLGSLGKGVIPYIHDALRASDDERFSGDLARILRGTDPPPDIAALMAALLRSDDPEIREKAMMGLKGADVDPDLLIAAAIANLRDAPTDQERSMAASALFGMEEGAPEQVIPALRAALDAVEESNPRWHIARMLALQGPGGARALAQDAAARDDLAAVLGAHAIPDADVAGALLDAGLTTEDARVRGAALMGLRKTGRAAIGPIDEALARVDDPALRAMLEEARTAAAAAEQ